MLTNKQDAEKKEDSTVDQVLRGFHYTQAKYAWVKSPLKVTLNALSHWVLPILQRFRPVKNMRQLYATILLQLG